MKDLSVRLSKWKQKGPKEIHKENKTKKLKFQTSVGNMKQVQTSLDKFRQYQTRSETCLDKFGQSLDKV